MCKLSYQQLGSSWAVAISCPTEELLQQYYWSFLNWGATGGNNGRIEDAELNLLETGLQDKFSGYFFTTPAKLLRAMENIEAMKMAIANDKLGNNAKKGKTFGEFFKVEIKRLARERFDSMVKEPILDYRTNKNYLNI